MIQSFKWIAILEGISFLLILFVTMPLKYIFDMGQPNQIIGMAHGFLFLAYVVMSFLVKSELHWNIKTLLIVLACSVIPFGTFWMERKYLEASKN
ncbi:MAG: hypothetical protein COA80_19250 [Leeuwenhoekiella sp.]|nr:MAG: hypothetical protein COA80_19250 [Leeuwenhoekiella sp.]